MSASSLLPLYSSLALSMETCARVAGSLSLVASLLVISTAFVFPTMMENKIFMQMIVMASLCDFFASIAVVLGFPSGFLCSLQGTLIMFCFRGAWFWSIFMLLQLNYVVDHKLVYMSFANMNKVVWSVNLLLEFLPLTTRTWYRTSEEFAGMIVCTFDLADKNLFIWVCTCFAGPMNLTVLTVLFLACKLVWRVKHISGEYSKHLLRSIAIYPAIMMICFCPFVFLYFTDINVAPASDATNFTEKYRTWSLIYCWVSLQGTFNAAAFFINSVEARTRWSSWLRDKYLNCWGRDNDDAQKLLSTVKEDFVSDECMMSTDERSRKSANADNLSISSAKATDVSNLRGSQAASTISRGSQSDLKLQLQNEL
jgi:hypothetical protein